MGQRVSGRAHGALAPAALDLGIASPAGAAVTAHTQAHGDRHTMRTPGWTPSTPGRNAVQNADSGAPPHDNRPARSHGGSNREFGRRGWEVFKITNREWEVSVEARSATLAV